MKKNRECYPIPVFGAVIQEKNSITFFTDEKEIIIEDYVYLIRQILLCCDGYTSKEEIIREMRTLSEQFADVDIEGVINDLFLLGILTDSREIMLSYHRFTENPQSFFRQMSQQEAYRLQAEKLYLMPDCVGDKIEINHIRETRLGKLLRDRCSCRSFLQKEIDTEIIASLCYYSIGDDIEPVASAGNLHPLSIGFILQLPSGKLEKGGYIYDKQRGLLPIAKKITKEEIAYALNDSQGIYGAVCVFFVFSKFNRSMQKYSNRGYRYCLLEAGHVIQNLTLLAGDFGLGGVEYGGYKDDAVRELFGWDEEVFPVSCYAVGFPADEGSANDYHISDRINYLYEEMKRTGILEEIVVAQSDRLKKTMFEAVYCICRGNDSLSLKGSVVGMGVDHTFQEAYLKSMMEAYERYVCGRYYSDIVASKNELILQGAMEEEFLDVETYFPLMAEQKAECCLEEFSDTKQYAWIKGADKNGKSYYIPADVCFYPYAPLGNPNLTDRKILRRANSSGVSAHFNKEKAIRLACLELIERDAIMRLWYSRRGAVRISTDSLPAYIRKYISSYKEEGLDISFFLLESEYAYVVLAVSRGEKIPYFVSGGGASRESIEEAIEDAQKELLVALCGADDEETDNLAEPIQAVDVSGPQEHGRFYAFQKNEDVLQFLWNAECRSADDFKKRVFHSFPFIYMEYQPFFSEIHVVRVFSKKLIPIHFGYREDYAMHQEVKKVIIDNYDYFPHFFS